MNVSRPDQEQSTTMSPVEQHPKVNVVVLASYWLGTRLELASGTVLFRTGLVQEYHSFELAQYSLELVCIGLAFLCTGSVLFRIGLVVA